MKIYYIANNKAGKSLFNHVSKTANQNSSELFQNPVKETNVNWSSAVEKDIDAIQRADLIIADGSDADLALGILAFTAFRYKKPTLILVNSSSKDQFLSNVSNKYLHVGRYQNEEEIESLVATFIKENAIAERDLRFNMFLNRPVYRYLRTTAYESGKTKSQIAREILEKAAQNK